MKILLVSLCIFMNSVHAMKIDRVIVSTDANPKYYQFWPLVAQAWKQLVGIQPTVIFIGDEDFPIDTTCGDVIRFKPIEGISTALQAQVIRLFAGVYFPNEVFLISDMDMIPCSRSYYVDSVSKIPEDRFVIYRGKYDGVYPMCYIATKGFVANEMFKVHSVEDIVERIKEWEAIGFGWNTDQILLTRIAPPWGAQTGKVVFLEHGIDGRVDRLDWEHRGRWLHNRKALRQGKYIDAHLLRPMNDHWEENMEVVRDLGIHYP